MTTFTPIDLAQLPDPQVVEQIDYEQILAERKAFFISLHPADKQAAIAATLELESEPVTKLLQENAYRETIWRQRVNEAALATLLAKAKGTDLEQLAANVDVKKLLVTPGKPQRRATGGGCLRERRQPARTRANGLGRPQHGRPSQRLHIPRPQC